MNGLLRHTGYLLLAPPPREGERGAFFMVFGLIFIGMYVIYAFLFLREGRGWPLGQTSTAFMGLSFIEQGALRAVPPRWRRVVLGLRAAITATLLMAVLSLPLIYSRDYGRGASLELFLEPRLFWTMTTTALLVLCVNYLMNYLANRREARRSSRPGSTSPPQ